MDSTGKRVAFILALTIVVFLCALYARNAMHTEYMSTYKLPVVIGDWRGEDAVVNIDFLRSELGTQNMIFRSYSNGKGVVTMYLAYYKDVDSANRCHSPNVCYPGQGWTVAADDMATVDVHGRNFDINRLVINKNSETELVYNWWQTGDAVFPRNSTNRFYQMFKSILGKNPSTVWVRLSVRASNDKRSDEEMLIRFTKDIMPLLGNYFTR